MANASSKPVGKFVECGGVVFWRAVSRRWLCGLCHSFFDGKPANHYVRTDA